MSTLAKAKVDDLLAIESHQLCKQNNHKIDAAMGAPVNGAGNISPTKYSQFQVCLIGPQQAPTTASDPDRQMAIEIWKLEIQQVSPVQLKVIDK
jgi:hypothetical protein